MGNQNSGSPRYLSTPIQRFYVPRGREGWMASLTQWSLSRLLETVKAREAWRAAVYGVPKSQTGPRDKTTTVPIVLKI